MERREEQEQKQLIWKSEPESMVSITIGRTMATLLAARPKKLHHSISRLSPDSSIKSSLDSLDYSLWFLHKYVRDAAQRDGNLDEILVPIIQHSLKYKDSKHDNQPMILLNWLFQDEFLFQAVAMNLANIITRKDDRYIAFGWCTLVRGLMEYENVMDQYLFNGIKEKYSALLKMLCTCIPHLSCIARKGSTLQDKFELPSRLSVAAADCLLTLTEGLTKKPMLSSRTKSLKSSESNPPVSLLASSIDERKISTVHKSSEVLNVGMEDLFWDYLQDLIYLVERLLAWSRKSRPLHTKGLEQVLKWLKEIQVHYGGLQEEAQILKTRALLLSSCWKHYGMLLHLEDKKFNKQYKELLDQYLSGIQYYSNNYVEGHAESKDGGIETRKFFINCLCLLLGRFDGKQLECVLLDYGKQISHVLLSQLHCNDEDVIDGVVHIFKVIIFKTNNSSGSTVTDTNQMDSMVPLLLHLLDERDAAARAVVMLIAEYCSISTDGHCLEEVLKRLDSGNAIKRRNAFDVISELVHISKDSSHKAHHSTWQVIANHLLGCLEYEEAAIQEQTPNLLPLIDPSFVLPALVHLVCLSEEKAQAAASEALFRVLKHHNQKPEVICMMLDSLRNLSQDQADAEAGACMGKGSNFDCNRVLRLIPEWSKTVEDWNALIGPLIDKMFAEPSNATIVRFLSCINEQLAEAADVVLSRVVFQMKGQKGIDEDFFSRWETKTCPSDDSMRMQQSLFERLCPLLIVRLLPLRVFNDLNSSVVYGQLRNAPFMHEYGDVSVTGDDSVVAFLVNRAFSRFEFEDVRKLAAELCGRIHPQVLLPLVCSQLEHATESRDILKIIACLFSVCTSLVVRGKESLVHPFILQIWRTIKVILLWPSSDGDQVSKAQHGCIDCLALMICAESQAPESFENCTSWKRNIAGKKGNRGNAITEFCALRNVISQLINDESDISGSKLPYENCEPVPVPFRLCMANVLISACQKISNYGKEPLAKTILPCLIDSVEVETQPEIRAAFIQVMFSAVYHLKLAVLPYSRDLLKLSLKFLGKRSEQERMAAAKLMASLMTSEDPILESISHGLVEARSVLSDIALNDPSFDIQQLCKKLATCITST
ncbi:uncharacterized protein LOC105786238 isoform X1 [Gossypium raimondii]|uniref:Uncharacterized protein n=2 Tax=Gossypium raimondii TaxID=29730 RepID=A0A0D2QAQ9_GOSRA|nr:uncharacterized protein LOC105786238 isoform X1 [Gossypium raimondii]KJB16439.1 hypothetical protein B456_002G230200 [Gossypium raimondii]